MQRVATHTENLAQLCAAQVALRIPSYQRPYVWPAEDVEKLLHDISEAQREGQPHYYVGTLISTASAEVPAGAARCLDLIDGQQRTTTLVLIALAFRQLKVEHPLVHMPLLQQVPAWLDNMSPSHGQVMGSGAPQAVLRLCFAIREASQAFLAHAAGLPNAPALDAQQVGSEYVQGLARGLRAAKQKLVQLRQKDGAGQPGVDLLELADFVYRKVVWVHNCIPSAMNANSLFSRVNTSGVQLEQSDILKAQLLAKIHSDKRRYDAIWQVCERLNNFFERNVREVFAQADWKTLKPQDLARFDAAKFPLQGDDAEALADGLTLADIAHALRVEHPERSWSPSGRAAKKTAGVQPEDTGEPELAYCRSIIGFPLLLMQALRVHYAEQKMPDIGSRLHGARLGECFAEFVAQATEAQTREFLECLWRVRFQFDCWVAKWQVLEQGEPEHLCLKSVSLHSGRITRSSTEVAKDLVQLQAVRNFTGERSAQYWIAPFLQRMMAHEMQTATWTDAVKVLEQIDNTLSLAQGTQKEASAALLRGAQVACDDWQVVEHYLQEQLGTGFAHYWFQKLEYVLWRERETNSSAQVKVLEPKRWERFRISSKNSVEHVYPQQHEFEERRAVDAAEAPASLGRGATKAPDLAWIDGWGNLVLLSPGENSSYSNQDPIKKKVDFGRNQTYDSLKLAHLFHAMGTQSWSEELAAAHQDQMLGYLRQHYAA